jgi:peptidoglycan hydrolase-like protein with peptidoglycan-binding domain
MIFERRTVRRAFITSMSAAVLLLLLANSGAAPLADSPSDISPSAVQAHLAVRGASPISPSAAQAGDLSGCPDLRRGQDNNADCVRALQQALNDNGYPDQPVTGYFGPLTEANVRAFQRSHHIRPVSGIVATKTRAALLSGGTAPRANPPVPRVGPADFANSYCQSGECHFYLRRAATRQYADWLDAHPALSAMMSSALLQGACRVLRSIKSVSVICMLVGSGVGGYLGNQLQQAARQDSCLRLSVRLLPTGSGWRLLEAKPDNSWRCAN